MKPARFFLSIILFALFTAGCVQVVSKVPNTSTPLSSPAATISETIPAPSLTITPLPTITPSPSATLTLFPTASDTPTSAFTVTITETPTRGPSPTRTRTITPTPTITFTPTPPFSVLRISKPGLLSRVISPIKIEAMVSKGDDGYVYINLIGEDSRVISSQALDYHHSIYSRFLIAPALDFSIPEISELGRLEIKTIDLFGRTIALSSVELVLLSIGSNEIYPPESLLEPFIVRYPYEGQYISGGEVLVYGLAAPVNNTPLVLELIDEQDQIIGSTQISIPPPSEGLSHSPFSINIPYSISGTTPVRLTLRQESDNRIPGTVALFSFPLVLEP